MSVPPTLTNVTSMPSVATTKDPILVSAKLDTQETERHALVYIEKRGDHHICTPSISNFASRTQFLIASEPLTIDLAQIFNTTRKACFLFYCH